jgi:hypothetical protein
MADYHIIRNAMATPPGENWWSKVAEGGDEEYGNFNAGWVYDETNPEHVEFLKELTEVENSCRKEAGLEPVDVTTALKSYSDKDGRKVKVLKATSKFEPETACKVNGWSPLKYNPWGGDIIQIAFTPAFNTGAKKKRDTGLKLRLSQLAIVEECEAKKDRSKKFKEKKGKRPNLLGITVPDSIEVDGSGPDTGDDTEIVF